MSYQCGIGPGMTAVFGISEGPPRIICDGCGRVELAEKYPGGPPKAWLLSGKAPKGWALTRPTENTRYDTCPDCRKTSPARPHQGANRL